MKINKVKGSKFTGVIHTLAIGAGSHKITGHIYPDGRVYFKMNRKPKRHWYGGLLNRHTIAGYYSEKGENTPWAAYKSKKK